MKTKLNTAVYGPDGELTTIAELADTGKIEFEKVENFRGKRTTRTVYLATIKGTKKAWEIGKRAYLSRTRESNNI